MAAHARFSSTLYRSMARLSGHVRIEMAQTHLKKRSSSSQLQGGLPHAPSSFSASSQSSQRSLASRSNELLAQSKQILAAPLTRYGHLAQLPNPAGCGRLLTLAHASSRASCCPPAESSSTAVGERRRASTSSTERISIAPRFSTYFCAQGWEVTRRLTRNTRLPCSSASRACILAPEVSLASITTVPWLIPEVTTLRRGKL